MITGRGGAVSSSHHKVGHLFHFRERRGEGERGGEKERRGEEKERKGGMQRGLLDSVPGAVPFMFLWDGDERGRKRRGSLVSVTTISQSHGSSAYMSTVLRSDHYEGKILK